MMTQTDCWWFRNPEQPLFGCINPCKQCDIYHINWWSPHFFQIRWIMSWGFGDTMRALRTGGYATTHAGGTWSYHCQKRTHQEGPKDIETSKLDSGEKSSSLQTWDFVVPFCFTFFSCGVSSWARVQGQKKCLGRDEGGRKVRHSPTAFDMQRGWEVLSTSHLQTCHVMAS